MRMNQEVDAMQVMGVNPFLRPGYSAPRIDDPDDAAADLHRHGVGHVRRPAGDLEPAQLRTGLFSVQRVSEDPMMGTHLMVGMIKAPVFAVVIAAIGFVRAWLSPATSRASAAA